MQVHKCRQNGDIVSLMTEEFCLACNFAAHGFHHCIKPEAHNINAFFAVIINQIHGLNIVFYFAVVQAEGFNNIKSIQLFAAINFFCKIIARAERQNHYGGLSVRKAVCYFVNSAVAPAGNNNAILAVFCGILRRNFLGMAFIACFFNNHFIINHPESGLNLPEKKLLILSACDRIFNKHIFHISFPTV